MKKQFIKILISIFFLMLYSIGCGGGKDSGNNPFNPSNPSTPPPTSNYEPPATNTQEAKNFLYNFNMYSKAEKTDGREYKFDTDASLTITDANSVSYTEKSLFWGMSPDNKEIAYYYTEQKGSPTTYYTPKGAYIFKNDFIVEEYEYRNKMESHMFEASGNNIFQSGFSDMEKIMHPVDNQTIYYDHKKINPAQNNTADANTWKTQVNGKSMSGNYMGDNNATFTFKDNGDVTINYETEVYGPNGPTGQKVQTNETFTFWGAYKDNQGGMNSLYGLYYIRYGDNNYYNTVAFYIQNYNGSYNIFQSGFSDMEKIMHPVDNQTIYYDHKKINPAQNNTADANTWKTQVNGKSMSGNYMGDNNATFTFKDNGDVTINYETEVYGPNGPTGQKVQTNETFTFWGAYKDNQGGMNSLYGLYYIRYGDNNYYNTVAFYIDEDNVRYDYTKLKPLQNNTTEAMAWKNKVASKTFKEQYLFDKNGDIKDMEDIYSFWGVKSATEGIYYTKFKLKDIFGDKAPESDYYYIYHGFKLENNSLFMYHPNEEYYNSFKNWSDKNFNSENINWSSIDWASMPLSKKEDIDWNRGEEVGKLIR